MANLAIKGHATRGSEVIGLLEMLGGKNNRCLHGVTTGLYYFIDCGGICSCELVPDYYRIFTLEQFLEKFPYKVGDRVYYQPIPQINSLCISDIISMNWINSVVYYTSNGHEVYACDLQPYTEQKEKSMEETENSVVVNNEHKQLKVHSLRHNKVQLMIDDKYELKQEGNAYYIVKKQPQYPKTYEECCDILKNT